MKKTFFKIVCSLMVFAFVISAGVYAVTSLNTEENANDAPIKVNALTVEENNDVLLTASAADPIVTEALDTKQILRFNEDGSFKILVFSDLQEEYPIKDETLEYMNKMLDNEKPDLVLFTGDNHCGRITNKSTMKKYLSQMAEPMESRQIPWAQVYGNHVEGGYGSDCGISKEYQQEVFESFDYNVSKAGTVSGSGNYVIPVLRSDSDEIAYNVFCFDSHDYMHKYGDHHFDYSFEEFCFPATLYSGNKYDVIHFDQIKWYWDTSVALEKYNGKAIPAMMMFHIPLVEMKYISDNPDQTGFDGYKGDPISSPEINSGLFWALYERGDVKLIVNGHDHLNTFQGEYMGVTMAYAGSIGGVEYNNDESKGVRIVEIKQNDAQNVDTYMVYTKDLD